MPSAPADGSGGAPAKAADLREAHLPDVSDTPPYAFPLFRRLSDLFGAKLPDDITFESVDPADPALVATEPFRCSYDEGFGGHFTVPGGEGAAARFDLVMSNPEPFTFIQQHLCCVPREAAAEDGGEIVIFSPGLNTLHMVQPGFEHETTTPQRLQRYADILQRPLAQLHIGTDMDQGPAPVMKLPWLARALLWVNAPIFRRVGFTPPVDADGHITLSPPTRDFLEAMLSAIGFARPLWQAHALRLLEFNETAQQPLVLMPYSRTTAELSSALRRFRDGYVKRYKRAHGRQAEDRGRAEAEQLLRKTLTVVTLGNVDLRWVDGPAYIHLSALCDRPDGLGTDPLTSRLGVSEQRQTFAGRDAVFLHFDGVYAGMDAHNFGAAGAPALRMALKMNGAVTLRGLWEKGQEGPLRAPGAEQMRAAAVAAGAEEWLWDAENAHEGVTLPPAEEVQGTLEGVW